MVFFNLISTLKIKYKFNLFINKKKIEMQNKGIMILLLIIFAVLVLYFSIFGFSFDKYWRWGQYLSLVTIFFFFMDEMFKE